MLFNGANYSQWWDNYRNGADSYNYDYDIVGKNL
jgi:hypothetical protein